MTKADPTSGPFSGLISEMVPDAILVVEPDGGIRFANSSVSDLFGYDPDELVGEPVEVLVPEGLREEHIEQRETYFAAPESRPMGVGLDLVGQRKDGSVFPIDVRLSPVTFEGDEAVIAVVRDTTEQEELRSKYEALLETAPDAFIVADARTGTIIDANEQATALTGYSREELEGMHQAELHPSEDVESYRSLFDRHIETDGIRAELPDGSPIYIETKDGDHVPVEINARTFELQGQELITGSFRDISGRRARERELERQNERLDEFARVVAHDLRNPLVIAGGRVDLAMDECDSEHLSVAQNALHRMDELIDDTLTLAKQGAQVGETEPVDLERLVNECWQTVDTRSAELSFDDPPVVQADRSRLKQLLENLLRNAVDHGDPPVSVTVGGLADGSGFFVEDDGPGIPADERDDVFQVGESTSEEGTGLGLAIVERIVEAHDWEIRVTEDEQGGAGGARFEILTVRPSN